MKIGIDGSRAFLQQRTGIEEYSYQVIKNLRDKFPGDEVILYVRKNQEIDFPLPENWKIKVIGWSRFWTQGGLSWEMFRRPADALFVPAHTVPFLHPKKTIVTIHGLEYEIMPQAYSYWERVYMRFSIKNSCRWAKEIISVSRNTKQDLMALYGVSSDKIRVIYEGYNAEEKVQSPKSKIQTKESGFQKYKPYLLFVGRLEERKNIVGIVETFEILKREYDIPHKLVLAGRSGYKYGNIEDKINNSDFKKDIYVLGFVPDGEKFNLIKEADVFMFPTFYEGFGIPILEAQSAGVPVVTSNISSMPEVAGEAAILVDPNEPVYIAERTYPLISDVALRDDIIKKGYTNAARFSWEECAKSLANVIKNGN